ncbi:helix-turn-helix domain-containing protein [Synechococcus sp. CCY 9618]|uniref:AlbA family DNA-binding domain-containing protein n=1 Tax=Synechococcus sp. CCY 9618 TaxID=2815602 RepID=UPI001C2180AA|nr:ATP-binding protein [Synechococcus sp. CCY 9618]
MDEEFLISLLYEEEGATLDFKREQYRFANATNEDKSELLKDILGFANAWRRADAYVLVGVEEVRGGKSIVHGVASQLDDHALQQFVNSLTNRPIQFHYRAAVLEQKEIGVIHIEKQDRPIFLKRDYGKLEKVKVYVRRGSSTNPTMPADPDEIFRMGLSSEDKAPTLVAQFADIKTQNLLGQSLVVSSRLCELPQEHQIPQLPDPPIGQFGFRPVTPYRTNSEYYRQLAKHIYIHELYRPVALALINSGRYVARNVRVELEIAESTNIDALEECEIPSRPKKQTSGPDLSGFMPRRTGRPGDLIINRLSGKIKVEVMCGDVQPGRRIYSDQFFLGKRTEEKNLVLYSIYSDDLPEPIKGQLDISAVLDHAVYSSSDLLHVGNRF